MKFAIVFFTFISFSVCAQNPASYLAQFDAKIYSLRNKGVKDFSVDIVSSRLTQQMNDQIVFGKINELIFRVYWTANPERFAIEIFGLPEGFKEIKEELKLNIMVLMDGLIPLPIHQQLAGYQFFDGAKPKEILAKDSTGIASIPSYTLFFDREDKLTEIQGQRPVGTYTMKPVYIKTPFSGGHLVLKGMSISSVENGQSFNSRKEFEYGSSNGVGVLTEITLKTEQKMAGSKDKPLILEESVEFKNYKIDAGEGQKYFLRTPDSTKP